MQSRPMTKQQIADLKAASENLTDMAAACALNIQDNDKRERVISELEAGKAEIRQVTELVPGTLTSKITVKLTSGEEVLLLGVSF